MKVSTNTPYGSELKGVSWVTLAKGQLRSHWPMIQGAIQV